MIAPALLLAAAAPARFAAPVQPWASGDGQVHLLRPAAVRPAADAAPLGALMAPGWRLLWDGAAPSPGTLAVRLALPAVPAGGPGAATEVLQVGFGTGPAALRTCLAYGLGGEGRRLPDRTINGVRFRAWAHADAGMSQAIDAIDLRAVVAGRCWAVARFGYTVRAVDRPAAAAMPEATAAALLDRALASLQLGPVPAPAVLRPPVLRLPPGAVAR